jgi:hypothetical protein
MGKLMVKLAYGVGMGTDQALRLIRRRPLARFRRLPSRSAAQG